MKIRDLFNMGSDEPFEITALVVDASSHRTQNGSIYMKLELQDSSGRIGARVWDNVEELSRHLQSGIIADLTGRISVYRGEVQLTIETAKPNLKARLEDVFPSAPFPIKEMEAELNELVLSISRPPLRQLVQDILLGREYRSRFLRHPAAKSIHHAYIGGLLHHTLTVARILDFLSRTYKDVDRDVLITGGILHDIGKLEEINIDSGFYYTDPGKLAGHVYLGAEVVERYGSRIKSLSPRTLLLVKHIILSHHGQLEFGSPVTPKTPEAIIVHHVEYMDSRVNHVLGLISNLRRHSSDLERRWTDYSHAAKAEFYIPTEEDLAPSEEDENKKTGRRLFDD